MDVVACPISGLLFLCCWGQPLFGEKVIRLDIFADAWDRECGDELLFRLVSAPHALRQASGNGTMPVAPARRAKVDSEITPSRGVFIFCNLGRAVQANLPQPGEADAYRRGASCD